MTVIQLSVGLVAMPLMLSLLFGVMLGAQAVSDSSKSEPKSPPLDGDKESRAAHAEPDSADLELLQELDILMDLELLQLFDLVGEADLDIGLPLPEEARSESTR